jgi:hypothetical protein
MPYGKERRGGGSDIGLWSCDDFYESEPEVLARTNAADDSGIHINRQLRQNGGGT